MAGWEVAGRRRRRIREIKEGMGMINWIYCINVWVFFSFYLMWVFMAVVGGVGVEMIFLGVVAL